MEQPTGQWNSKSDKEIIEAVHAIDRFSEEEQLAIRAEAARRTSRKGHPLQISEPKGSSSVDSNRESGVEVESALALSNRYRDGYVHAATTVGISQVIKIVGVALGSLIFLLSLSSGVDILIFGGFALGAVVGALFYFLGIGVATQGQTLMATLDSAVNSSPFLDESQRAKIMGLK